MSFKDNSNLEAYMNKRKFHDDVRKFTLSLYDNPSIPRNEVQNIIDKVGSFISQSHNTYIQNEMDRILRGADNEVRGKVHVTLEQTKHPFKDFSSEHMRFNCYKKESMFFEPESFQIGEDEDQDSVYGAHISLIKTLKVFLELPGVYQSMKEYMKCVENEKDVIFNITQAKLWRTKYHKDGRNAFPFFVFFDDMQPGNTLGSHASQQKLGMVYGSLPCLPPHIVAKLTNIFLMTVFHSKDRTKFGNSAVFEKIKNDLNELSEKGMTVCVDGIEEIVYFDCLLLIGDNLGLNSCCGFTESFNAHYYCRICHASSSQCKKFTVEEESLLRTKKSYESDLINQTRGLKQECTFNYLPKFHVAENHSLDLMHDLFEGVGRDDIENILTILIFKKKLFTLKELNDRIEKFDYGNESTNKPVPLLTETCKPCDRARLGTSTKIKAKQSAAEMACLIRYLGLILDDLIPSSEENVDYWILYVTLRQIVAIVTAPRYVIFDVYKVQILIKQHHELYLKLFGDLKPKHHFMTHIPRIMMENGPLTHFWSMMFERKHRDYKNIAKNVTCSKDLPYTIAFRNQILLSCKKERAEISENEYKFGPVNNKDNNIELQMQEHFERITSIQSYKLIEIMGHIFTSGTIFVKGIEDDEPTFAKLKNVLKINGQVYLYASTLPYLSFDYKYYAHEIQNNDVPDTLINIDDMCYVPPAVLFISKKSKFYVATKYDV